MERTRNNTVTQTKNVLGKTKTKVTKGNQVTSVSPFLVARDSALGKELYEIDRLNKQLDEVKYRFMEVSIFDSKGDEKFAHGRRKQRSTSRAGAVPLPMV